MTTVHSIHDGTAPNEAISDTIITSVIIVIAAGLSLLGGIILMSASLVLIAALLLLQLAVAARPEPGKWSQRVGRWILAAGVMLTSSAIAAFAAVEAGWHWWSGDAATESLIPTAALLVILAQYEHVRHLPEYPAVSQNMRMLRLAINWLALGTIIAWAMAASEIRVLGQDFSWLDPLLAVTIFVLATGVSFCKGLFVIWRRLFG